MNNVRSVIAPTLRRTTQQGLPLVRLPVRSVGYLHKGARVRGLMRDESHYLVNPKGLAYGANDQSLSTLKTLLGSEYALPDEVSLQVITHKSFAHGKKPFNEKLAVLGSHFLKYKATLFTINTQGLDRIGSHASKELISDGSMAYFLQSTGVGESIYWKKRDPLQTDPKRSGEVSVYARTGEAILGAILLTHGKEKATKFVDEVLLGGNNSLVKAVENRSPASV